MPEKRRQLVIRPIIKQAPVPCLKNTSHCLKKNATRALRHCFRYPAPTPLSLAALRDLTPSDDHPVNSFEIQSGQWSD